jgi:hypothetical protein
MKGKNKILTLEARIRILVEKLADQAATFDKMNNKLFALVGLLLTLGGLLTYNSFAIKEPDTLLEAIIFIAALILLGVTVLLVGYDYRSKKNWDVPIGPVEEVKLDNAKNYEEALDIIHMDYLVVYHGRMKLLERKSKILNAALYAFVISVILLIVLKIGG